MTRDSERTLSSGTDHVATLRRPAAGMQRQNAASDDSLVDESAQLWLTQLRTAVHSFILALATAAAEACNCVEGRDRALDAAVRARIIRDVLAHAPAGALEHPPLARKIDSVNDTLVMLERAHDRFLQSGDVSAATALLRAVELAHGAMRWND